MFAYRPERWNIGGVARKTVCGRFAGSGSFMRPAITSPSTDSIPDSVVVCTKPMIERCDASAPLGRPVVPLV